MAACGAGIQFEFAAMPADRMGLFDCLPRNRNFSPFLPAEPNPNPAGGVVVEDADPGVREG